MERTVRTVAGTKASTSYIVLCTVVVRNLYRVRLLLKALNYSYNLPSSSDELSFPKSLETTPLYGNKLTTLSWQA